jgi:hypothetical protein
VSSWGVNGRQKRCQHKPSNAIFDASTGLLSHRAFCVRAAVPVPCKAHLFLSPMIGKAFPVACPWRTSISQQQKGPLPFDAAHHSSDPKESCTPFPSPTLLSPSLSLSFPYSLRDAMHACMVVAVRHCRAATRLSFVYAGSIGTKATEGGRGCTGLGLLNDARRISFREKSKNAHGAIAIGSHDGLINVPTAEPQRELTTASAATSAGSIMSRGTQRHRFPAERSCRVSLSARRAWGTHTADNLVGPGTAAYDSWLFADGGGV